MTKATFHVDGRTIVVPVGDQPAAGAAWRRASTCPYFCWHPALGSVGACRQCAVKQLQGRERQARPHRDVLHDALRRRHLHLDRASRKRREMRKAVIEFLMTNHPHDCPVCEEGGHCHLQDMTVMTGHNYRRYRFTKRTHRNQDLGPFIGHEMNRCISCYRCVRYYKDYAGGTDLDVFGSADNVYFGRAERRHAGNRVQRQPGRGLPDRRVHRQDPTASATRASGTCSSHRASARAARSAATSHRGERYGAVKRIENRYHGEINGYFLCDRGRFGYQYTNDAERPRRARGRSGEVLTAEGAVARAAVNDRKASASSALVRRAPRSRPTTPARAGRGREFLPRRIASRAGT